MEISHQLTRVDIAEASRPFVRQFVFRFWLAVVLLIGLAASAVAARAAVGVTVREALAYE